MSTSLAAAFERSVSDHPNAVALVHADGRFTYRELHDAATRCAGEIDRHAPSGTAPVAVTVARTAASVIGVLGTVLSGRPYVPIDSAYPLRRREFMLADCAAPVMVDGTGAQPSVRARQPDRPTPRYPDQLAYVIYTSGSTGRPKGCMVTNANVLSLFEATRELFHAVQRDVSSVIHSLAFDFSVWELWSAWLYGGAAWLVSAEEVTDPQRLLAGLARHGVTRLSSTPSLFTHLVGQLRKGDIRLPALRSVVLGGEPMSLADVRDFSTSGRAPHAEVVNMYGITETTVHVTYLRVDVDGLPVVAGTTPIGLPIPSLDIELRDGAGHPVPAGAVGEMWIAGAGVCAGYLNRDDMTRERFAVDGAGRRWYRSGDLASRDGAGFHYVGRVDRQVQLRGFRIELGEVEAALDGLAGVERSVAVVETRALTGQPVLVAYVCLRQGAPATVSSHLRERAGRLLPPQAVPQIIRVVDRMPLTPNGKVDLRALGTLAETVPQA
jgi:nonribosomal peptide synthetase DhbF